MAVSKPSSCFGTSHHSVISCIEEHITNDSLIKIQQNYIIPDQEAPIYDGTIFAIIPTIDMKELILINHEELKKLHSTCKEWGIFQLVNHGFNSSLLNKHLIGVTGSTYMITNPINTRKPYLFP
ncbi:hypothetical protein M0R45_009154 [Rubus argutus]|uniref:Non-haem dioxygenase N-terminal domain-containing protein n=1 Tax=Rubus argutus TaxID=59490 RepID=A0AAW1Y3N3_RUBAR